MPYETLPAVSSQMTPSCACCAPTPLRSGLGVNRRGFLNLGMAGVAGAAWPAWHLAKVSLPAAITRPC